jgi:flagellar biosynthetic protein FlhB
MAEDNAPDQDQKTEEPSERRLEKAREEGQTAISKEMVHWAFIACAAFVIMLLLPSSALKITKILMPLIATPDQFIMEGPNLKIMWGHILKNVALAVSFPILLLITAPVVATLIQTGRSISLKTLTPKLDRISPMKGFERIFSKRSVMELLKGVLKISLVVFALYVGLSKQSSNLEQWLWLSLSEFKSVLLGLFKSMFVNILLALSAVAALDYYFQRREFTQKMRMTKQEVKDEHKESDGNPEVKQKIRQLRQERSNKRMMAAVPGATAVITNPTHFSVAILWDAQTMNAPKVVAKGQDYIALRIREIAKENKVPVVENPPLARSLFSEVEMNQDIQPNHYKAVADVIRFVMKLKKQQF